MGAGGVGIARLPAAPCFDDGVMVGAHRVLEDVEPQVASFLPTCLRQSPQHRRRLGLTAGADVHVCHDVTGTALVSSQRRRAETLVRALVVTAHPNRFECIFEALRVRRRGVSVEGAPIPPHFNHDETTGPPDMLQEVESAVPILFPAGVAVRFHGSNHRRSRRRHDLHVRHVINGLVGCGLRLRDGCAGEQRRRKQQVTRSVHTRLLTFHFPRADPPRMPPRTPRRICLPS